MESTHEDKNLQKFMGLHQIFVVKWFNKNTSTFDSSLK
jgi:hypothetical protein